MFENHPNKHKESSLEVLPEYFNQPFLDILLKSVIVTPLVSQDILPLLTGILAAHVKFPT